MLVTNDTGDACKNNGTSTIGTGNPGAVKPGTFGLDATVRGINLDLCNPLDQLRTCLNFLV